MGGSVDVVSKLERGTEFVLNINCKCRVQDIKNSDFIRMSKHINKNSLKMRKNQTFSDSLNIERDSSLVFIRKKSN